MRRITYFISKYISKRMYTTRVNTSFTDFSIYDYKYNFKYIKSKDVYISHDQNNSKPLLRSRDCTLLKHNFILDITRKGLSQILHLHLIGESAHVRDLRRYKGRTFATGKFTCNVGPASCRCALRILPFRPDESPLAVRIISVFMGLMSPVLLHVRYHGEVGFR